MGILRMVVHPQMLALHRLMIGDELRCDEPWATVESFRRRVAYFISDSPYRIY
jgi:hypothetical protein